MASNQANGSSSALLLAWYAGPNRSIESDIDLPVEQRPTDDELVGAAMILNGELQRINTTISHLGHYLRDKYPDSGRQMAASFKNYIDDFLSRLIRRLENRGQPLQEPPDTASTAESPEPITLPSNASLSWNEQLATLVGDPELRGQGPRNVSAPAQRESPGASTNAPANSGISRLSKEVLGFRSTLGKRPRPESPDRP